MMIPIEYYLTVSVLLFAIGIYGVLSQKNAIKVLMCIEIMLNSANLNLVVFSAYMANSIGQIFIIFSIAIAASEIAVGLAILLLIFKKNRTVDLSRIGAFRRW